MKSLLASSLAIWLTGCCGLGGLGFKEAEPSGKGIVGSSAWAIENLDSAFFTNGKGRSEEETQLKQIVHNDKKLEDALKEQCAVTSPAVAPIAIPFIVAGAKLVFDLYVDQRKTTLEKLKDDALRTSSADLLLSRDKLAKVRCIVFSRTAEGDKPNSPGLVEVLHVDHTEDFLRFQPVFVRARNSLAKTAEGTNDRPAAISVSTAVALRQISLVDGVARLVDVGQASTTVKRVVLSEAVFCTEASRCESSSPIIAFPSQPGTVTVSLGVAEAGNVGIDITRATAELEAFKSAMGPALASAIEGRLKKDK
ncbi:MAG: hypothetical protein JO067_09995 [Cupriavidus sp.]|nr:hypothetical protein [Cupriavidus sp.]